MPIKSLKNVQVKSKLKINFYHLISESNDLSTAILQGKASPNKLLVDDSSSDDSSLVYMSPAKMEELQFFRGDTILIKGKRRKDTVAVILSDETCADIRIKLNKGEW